MITGGVGATLTIIRNDVKSDKFAASVTLAVKSKAPALVGVPEIDPLLAKASPGGRVPAVTDHVYGVAPPLAVSVCA